MAFNRILLHKFYTMYLDTNIEQHETRFTSLWVLLGIIAIVFGWYGFNWTKNHYSDQALFTAYYESPAELLNLSGAAVAQPLQAGFTALQAGRYNEAVSIFNNFKPGQDQFIEAQYYLGLAAMQEKDYGTAFYALRAATESVEPKIQEDATWYLALAYLATSRTEEPEFKSMLASVAASSNHAYNLEAQILQTKVRSFWHRIAK